MPNLSLHCYRGLPDWQVRIIKDYPRIYLEPDPRVLEGPLGQPQRTLPPLPPYYCNLRFGFECKAGWEKLLTQLSSVADSLCTDLRNSGRQPDARITACIAKEKFGQFRWQGLDNLIEPYRTLFHAYTWEIGHHSQNVCELCGRVGQIRNVKGWFTAICDQDFERLTGSENERVD
jgi:hypothetical protein